MFLTALHVLIPMCLCIAMANSGMFEKVLVDLTYDHYAERKVDDLPVFLAMPFNCLINLGYTIMGLYWLLQRTYITDPSPARYMKDVFAFMAIAYGPVQWIRLASLSRAAAVLDQWFTLPIFAWVPIWCHFIINGWRPHYALTVEVLSILSYTLSLIHDQGFEIALGGHVLFAVLSGVSVQRSYGDSVSLRYLGLAMLSCCGFVVLKLLDHTLATYWMFQNLTGHFWSKVCDILQFHYSFCFLTHLTENAQKRVS
ncbi:transmembrane protein 187 [Chanos chanos]|uniref:Transmembrane protein 187 n=1 Tax=Chanos chanos TaxID=29144 RepID=A0A6J2WKY5_CHACN|nr:transmembrane protein 187 [Chanos chanos]